MNFYTKRFVYNWFNGTATTPTPYSPSTLFTGGRQGVWYDPSDKSTMFQDAAGTVSVTKDGDHVGLVRDKSGNGNHATQPTAAKKPVYKTNLSRLSVDKVDDEFVINMSKRIVGSMTIATTNGIATYGVDIPAGNFTLGGRYFLSTNILGLVISEVVLSDEYKTTLTNMFVGKGAVESFVSITNFSSAWSGNNLTSFPLIDTSNGTNFQTTWQRNKLTSFPLINTSKGTNFYAAWYGNELTSFPLLDTSSGISFGSAWNSNPTLVNFPKNMFDNIKGGDFSYAFVNTGLSQESIDGILVSLVTSGISTGTRTFHQSGGSAPSAIGKSTIDTLRSRGWTVTVTGGY